MSSPFQSVMNTAINTLVPKRKIQVAEPENTLGMVTVALNNGKIASMPIMKGPKFMGFVSMFDIVAYVVQARLFDFSDKAKFEKDKVDIEHKTIVPHLTNCKKTEGAMAIDSNPLYNAIEIFATGSSHRLALLDANNEVSNIVSQSDVAKFLHGVMQKAGPNSPQTLAAKAAPVKSQGTVKSVTLDTLLDDAFAQMIDDGASTLAVVDKDGRLVGNLSPSDYIAVNFANMDCLKLTVERFLTDFSPKSLKPLTVSEASSLYAVLDVVVNNHVHGVWVVDKDGKPVNKISLTDVMRTVRDLKLSPSRGSASSKLPGRLTVEVTGAADLKKPANKVVFTLVGGKTEVTHETEAKEASDAPTLEGRFIFDLTETDSSASLVATLYNKADQVGKVSFSVPWCLAGFGTGSAGATASDSFPLDGGAGNINLSFAYK